MTESLARLRVRPPSPRLPWTAPRSDELVDSTLARTGTSDVRRHYLASYADEPGPVLAMSPFLPGGVDMAEHLMTNKRDVAIGAKFVGGKDSIITNMEGAAHTFLCALVPIKMHGDYGFRRFHSVPPFPSSPSAPYKLCRHVLLSTTIHPDFEQNNVFVPLLALSEDEVQGADVGLEFAIAKPEEKWDERKRKGYEDKLRKHLIYHLTSVRSLPSSTSVNNDPHAVIWSIDDAIARLTETLSSPPSETPILSPLINHYVLTSSPRRPTKLLSLEMLLNTYVASLVNEFSALEALCPLSSTPNLGGYIYTFDPPSIFAASFDATLLNRLMIYALRLVASTNALPGLKVFAFNDYADFAALRLLNLALRAEGTKHVAVMSRKRLFSGRGETLATKDAIPQVEGATLVIHNNSDAFGQNIAQAG
ncbi:hypothetical protein MNV49_005156 [Pseudohyphozyma bogoriensis]|nr:hypothetical protein MNV49_005156 [Pseudohyphozyma bogoriensis]